MTLEEAKHLIIFESSIRRNIDAAGVLVGQGIDPGRERIRTLLNALRMIKDAMRGKSEISKELAAALYYIGRFIPEQIEEGQRHGVKWPTEFADQERYDLEILIEEILGLDPTKSC